MPGIFYPIGTKVRLATGGPEMLVVDVFPDQSKAVVAWKANAIVREVILQTICLDIVRKRHVFDDRGDWL